MKVEILRTPGLDLLHDLERKGIGIPKDLVEGQVKDLSDEAAQVLIDLKLAKPVDKKSPESQPEQPAEPQRPARQLGKQTDR